MDIKVGIDTLDVLQAHRDVTYSVWNWLQAGATIANEPAALERLRQAVSVAIAIDEVTGAYGYPADAREQAAAS